MAKHRKRPVAVLVLVLAILFPTSDSVAEQPQALAYQNVVVRKKLFSESKPRFSSAAPVGQPVYADPDDSDAPRGRAVNQHYAAQQPSAAVPGSGTTTDPTAGSGGGKVLSHGSQGSVMAGGGEERRAQGPLVASGGGGTPNLFSPLYPVGARPVASAPLVASGGLAGGWRTHSPSGERAPTWDTLEGPGQASGGGIGGGHRDGQWVRAPLVLLPHPHNERSRSRARVRA